MDHSGREIDPRAFVFGKRYAGFQPLTIGARHTGRSVDFNFADFDMPVVRKSICRRVAADAGAGVQLVPVTVRESREEFEILNVVDVVECFDEGRSKFTKWTSEDGQPEKIGQYRMVAVLALDPRKARGHKIFRVQGWEVALIVEEQIKEILEEEKTSGIVFQAVG